MSRGEAAELNHSKEGGLEGLLGPNPVDPLTSSLSSKLSRAIDNVQLGDYFLHNFVVVVLPPLLHWHCR